jgi:hypothetical protein
MWAQQAPPEQLEILVQLDLLEQQVRPERLEHKAQ